MSSIGSAPAASAEFAELVANAPATGPELEDPEQEPPPDPGDGEKPSGDRPWMKYLQRNDAGDAVINLANAMTALRHAPELNGCFVSMKCCRSQCWSVRYRRASQASCQDQSAILTCRLFKSGCSATPTG